MYQKQNRLKTRLQVPYERFAHYLGIMHQKALELLDSLSDTDKKIINTFFKNYYRTKREHYWSITKLFCHAMYIPMFLQIGKSYFSKVVYIDTHSGPGLAKIGAEKNEVVLGSPLIALYWPGIIANQVSQFHKIADGFDELYFIDIDLRHVDVLKKFISNVSARRIYTFKNDANKVLPHINLNKKALVYMFIDPYGSFNSQLSHGALSSFIRKNRADIMMTIFATNVARGLSAIRDKYVLIENVERLFGKGFCQSNHPLAAKLCAVGEDKKPTDILKAYKLVLRNLGYHRIETIPVRYEKGILYYIMLAVRGGSGAWVDSYINYIRTRAPLGNYSTLKKMWLNVYKKDKEQRSIFEFLR